MVTSANMLPNDTSLTCSHLLTRGSVLLLLRIASENLPGQNEQIPPLPSPWQYGSPSTTVLPGHKYICSTFSGASIYFPTRFMQVSACALPNMVIFHMFEGCAWLLIQTKNGIISEPVLKIWHKMSPCQHYNFYLPKS